MAILLTLFVALLILLSLAALVYPYRPFKTRPRALLVLLLAFISVPFIGSPSEKMEANERESASNSAALEQDTTEQPLKRSEPERPITSQFVWVTADRLNRRTCPSTDCGIVGALVFREGTHVYEWEGAWARVSRYYNASCNKGSSEYVDSGNKTCTFENGIVDGQFAEWVSDRFLAEVRPPDPAALARGREHIIAQSDDFPKYRSEFLAAADSLIEARQCREHDFIENGGWIRSPKYRAQPIYFMFCGGSTIANRIYLDVRTGRVFR